ncbi:MAG: hypothetical protein A2Y17_06035 [Clostridiales bacterium GWF2_38_85]|nr:MAG: hypothetical protein A2Y17_06035 [Clostridiales bacterium GWF2_38_85]HBL83554.1 hypothetical protein [Clostridiales bacterium]
MNKSNLKKFSFISIISAFLLAFVSFVIILFFCSIIRYVNPSDIPDNTMNDLKQYYFNSSSNEISLISYFKKRNLSWHTFSDGYTVLYFETSNKYYNDLIEKGNINNLNVSYISNGNVPLFKSNKNVPPNLANEIESYGYSKIVFSNVDYNAPIIPATWFIVINSIITIFLLISGIITRYLFSKRKG